MGAYDTTTGRGDGPPLGYTPPAPPCEGEVDLLVYCTVAVQVTVATPYDDDEVAEIAAGEITYGARLVSVDRIEVDVNTSQPPAVAQPSRPGRGFLDRLRRV